ncbi:hypothetical protein DFH09DRAFT_1367549 [Mycena vulgaris]|nr:hypothetical protein DFH09DRAFT_1367549 [Mycena vulgaris]
MPASISSQSPPPAPAPRRRASASPARDARVKGITRKVIRTLEGLGHLDPALEAEADAEEDDDEHEVTRALAADAEARRVGAGKQRASMGGGDEEDRLGDPEEGFITLGLYLTPSMSPRTVALVLWNALAVIAPTDFVRLRSPAAERVYERALGFLMFESELHGTNGTLWYILGTHVRAVLLFSLSCSSISTFSATSPSSLPSILSPSPCVFSSPPFPFPFLFIRAPAAPVRVSHPTSAAPAAPGVPSRPK